LIAKDKVPAPYMNLEALKEEAAKERETGKADTAITFWEPMTELIPQLDELLRHKLAKTNVRAAGERAGNDASTVVFFPCPPFWFCLFQK